MASSVPAPLDLDQLLAEQDFVRRLARSLVFDQDRVDDVVQEAWLAAIRRPPRKRAAVPGWFGRVVHNLARRGARDALRRRVREQAVARAEALPSAAEVLAREQQRRLVVDAVLALPEPYRSTVLARFFDDLPPREIARRRGLPAATVRSQLLRALAMLRTRLDAGHGGDRRAWSLLLLPLARPARAAATSGLGLFTGALLMGKLLAVAGALALAVFGILWFAHEPALVPASGATGGGPGPVAAAREAAAGAAARPQRELVPVPAAGNAAPGAADLAGLRGRVLWSDGRPAQDQLVRVLGIDGVALFADAPASGDQRTLPLPRGQARTGLDGTFTIPGLWPRARYVIHAGADGPERTLRLCDVVPTAGAPTDVGDVVLAAKGTIVGRAVDDAGDPVAGAEVLALDLPAALGAVLPFDRFEPAHGGMLSVPLPAGTEDAGGYRRRLRGYLGRDLFERGDLDGEEGLVTLVVDWMPWLDALWQELPVARATSDAGGRFELSGVEPGGNVLVVRRAGLASGTRPRVLVTAGAVKDVGDVALPAGEELRVRVRDAGDRPVAGAEVRVASIGMLGYRGVAFAEAPVATDGDGRACAAGLPRGRAFVAVRATPRDPWLVRGPVATDDELQVALPQRHALALRITRADGEPVADATIELFAGPPLGELARAGVQGRLPVQDRLQRTGDGTFELRDLLPGCYTLQVAAPGAVPATTMTTLPREEPLALELAAARSIAVAVRDEDGAPVAGAKVYLLRDDAPDAVMPTDYGLPRWPKPPLLAGTSDAAGRLRIDGIPRSGAELHATHAHLAPASRRVGAGEETVELVLPRGGAIQGRLSEHGRAADPRRFRVVARPLAWGGVPLPELRTGLAADGTFAFTDVAPADYGLHAEPVSERPLSLHSLAENVRELVIPTFFGEGPVERRLTVASAQTATIEFDVDPNQPPPGVVPARLRGRALADGRPLAGLQLQRQPEPWSWNWVDVATVAADGTFGIDAIAPGEHHLRLQHGENTVWEGDVDLQPGVAAVLDLCWSTGTIAGQLAFAAGFPLADYVVTASAAAAGGSLLVAASTDAGGSFALVGVPAGDVEVRARGKDGRSEPQRVRVVAGATARVRIELRETPVLAGRVEFAGPARANAMVCLQGESTFHCTDLGPDGTFHFADLEPEVYELSLLGAGEVALTPHRFDLSQGAQRGVVVRAVVQKPAAGR